MFAQDPIRIEGLAKFQRDLKRMDKELPKALRIVQNSAAGLVVDWAQAEIPSVTGKARRSIRASSTRTVAQAQGGNARRAPYYPWLDFGGRVGRQGGTVRPFKKAGRYLYPGYSVRREQIHSQLVAGLVELAESSGVGTDG
jgi:hypothetical protein